MGNEYMAEKDAADSAYTLKFQWKAILESISTALIVCDISGQIHYVNASAERFLTGFRNPIQGALLAELLDLIDDTTGRIITDPILNCLDKSGNSGRFSGNAILRGDLRSFPIGLTVNLVRDLQKRIIGIAFELHHGQSS